LPILDSELMAPARAALQIGIAPATLRHWADTGKITPIWTPLGRCFRREEVDQLAAERRAQSAPGPEAA